MFSNWMLLVIIVIVVWISSNIIEHAATSPGTLVQLATSSTEYPYGYGFYYGNPYYYQPYVVPQYVPERHRGYSHMIRGSTIPYVLLTIAVMVIVYLVALKK
jgi:hypothetical protein